jgi:hypothetical protein
MIHHDKIYNVSITIEQNIILLQNDLGSEKDDFKVANNG